MRKKSVVRQVCKQGEALPLAFVDQGLDLNGQDYISYDIKALAHEFSLALACDKVIAYMPDHKRSMDFLMLVRAPGEEAACLVEIYFMASYHALDVLDEETFKHTVLKALMIGVDKVKIDLEMGHGYLNRLGLALKFSRSTKQGDFVDLKKKVLAAYDVLLDPKRPHDKSCHYKRSLTSMAIKKGQHQLAQTIDVILGQSL